MLGKLFDPYGFDVGELAKAVGAQLAAVAALFDAAEGETGVGFDDAVDEDIAGFDLGGEQFSGGDIACPEAGAKAIRGEVGEADGVVSVARRDEGGDGAEGFFRESGIRSGDVGENRGGGEEAAAREAGTAGGEGGAGGGGAR